MLSDSLYHNYSPNENLLFFQSPYSIYFFLTPVLFSCYEEAGIVEEEVVEAYSEPVPLKVHTKQPDVGKEIVFKAELQSTGPHRRIEYGFMWYQPEAEIIDVKEISVGVTGEVLDFEHKASNLPKGKLIVCSYARVASTQETIIGEEVPFSNDL